MSDTTKTLLKLISEGKTINEISEELKLSPKKIYNILTILGNKGFEFERKYYSDGSIVYIPKNNIFSNEVNNKVSIITSPNDQEFDAVVISDLHIGCDKERLDLLEKVYNYCIINNINIIIVTGDIINGMFGRSQILHDDVSEQIDYAIRNYPFDRNILNFAILGNHDINSLQLVGQDFAKILKNYRHDIVPVGYGKGQINIKNDHITLYHPKTIETDKFNDYLTLIGHQHRLKVSTNGKVNTIHVPSLSDIGIQSYETLPSAIKMTLKFCNGYLVTGHFEQLLIGTKTYTINEFNLNLGLGKNIAGIGRILNEEERTKKLIMTKPAGQTSQIDKFNKRWNSNVT